MLKKRKKEALKIEAFPATALPLTLRITELEPLLNLRLDVLHLRTYDVHAVLYFAYDCLFDWRGVITVASCCIIVRDGGKRRNIIKPPKPLDIPLKTIIKNLINVNIIHRVTQTVTTAFFYAQEDAVGGWAGGEHLG